MLASCQRLPSNECLVWCLEQRLAYVSTGKKKKYMITTPASECLLSVFNCKHFCKLPVGTLPVNRSTDSTNSFSFVQWLKTGLTHWSLCTHFRKSQAPGIYVTVIGCACPWQRLIMYLCVVWQGLWKCADLWQPICKLSKWVWGSPHMELNISFSKWSRCPCAFCTGSSLLYPRGIWVALKYASGEMYSSFPLVYHYQGCRRRCFLCPRNIHHCASFGSPSGVA